MAILNQAIVKQMAKDAGKRVGRDFLSALDEVITKKIDAAIHIHNGGRKTLDASVVYYILGKPK